MRRSRSSAGSATSTSTSRSRSPASRTAFPDGPLELPRYELGQEVATRKAYGEALAALGVGARRRRRARRRGQQLDVRRDLQAGASRPLLRDVHRRAAAGRRGGRPARARLERIRVHLRRVLLARVRLRPHGGDQPRGSASRRVARRRARSARTARRRWRSRTSPRCGRFTRASVLHPCDANQTAKLVVAMADTKGIVVHAHARARTRR